MLFTADGPKATRRTTHPHLERAVVALQYVRVFAVDAVLAGATAEDGAAVAAAVEVIDDPDDAVRWKVLTFLAWSSAEQLTAGVEHLRPRAFVV